jgi:hemoglobin/transferrin/lactoferrin receptor protein
LQLHTGTLFGSGATIRPNPNLVPETSNSYEFGARWNDGKFRLDGTVFYSVSQDYLTTATCAAVPVATCQTSMETTYTNINSAKTRGLELTAGYKIAPAYEVYGMTTMIRREFAYDTFSTVMSGVPLFSGRAGLRYEAEASSNIKWWWDAYMRGATSTEREEPGRVSGITTITAIGDWATYNLEFGATWKPRTPTGFTEHILSVAFTNIGNLSYRSSLEELDQAGRAIRVNLRSIF